MSVRTATCSQLFRSLAPTTAGRWVDVSLCRSHVFAFLWPAGSPHEIKMASVIKATVKKNLSISDPGLVDSAF